MITSFNTAWIESLGASLLANTINVMLVNNQHIPDPNTHTNIATVAAANIIATQTLTGKAFSQGRFTANDVVFPGIATATNIQTLLVYDDMTKLIIATIQDVHGLSVTGGGTDGLLKWGTDCAVFTL